MIVIVDITCAEHLAFARSRSQQTKSLYMNSGRCMIKIFNLCYAFNFPRLADTCS
jgi:hypothetical protein